MKILVPVKRVPNPDERIRVDPTAVGIDESALTFVVNPFDAIALEEALRIRERGAAPVEVIAVSLGPETVDSELRTALAMGADRAVRIAAAAGLDPWNVACGLADFVKRESPNLVLMGKQAVDDDSSQVGQMLAGLLHWPQATFVSKIEQLDDGRLRVQRETDQGLETLAIRLPAVVTADLRLNEPRYASLVALMKARKRPIETLSLEDLGATGTARLKTVRLEQAGVERSCVRLDSVEELVRRLKVEAKVL